MLFIGAFSLGFLFQSAAIAITAEIPEGMHAEMTLLTMPFFAGMMFLLASWKFSKVQLHNYIRTYYKKFK